VLARCLSWTFFVMQVYSRRLDKQDHANRTINSAQGETVQTFELQDREYIELNNLLKITGLCGSGGIAKLQIADGLVTVDGQVELRKRCKIRQGQVVEFKGHKISVVQIID